MKIKGNKINTEFGYTVNKKTPWNSSFPIFRTFPELKLEKFSNGRIIQFWAGVSTFFRSNLERIPNFIDTELEATKWEYLRYLIWWWRKLLHLTQFWYRYVLQWRVSQMGKPRVYYQTHLPSIETRWDYDGITGEPQTLPVTATASGIKEGFFYAVPWDGLNHSHTVRYS